MKAIDDSIRKLAQGFKNNPVDFFSEVDFQYKLFSILKKSKDINRQIRTKDRKLVSLVRPEYPSVKRVQLASGKGYRVWFDIAVLKPQFVRQNLYETVIARDERKAKAWGENVLAAIEIKYFPRKSKTILQRVEEDCFKLSQCREVRDKYVLVFSKFPVQDSNIGEIKKRGVRLIWVYPEDR